MIGLHSEWKLNVAWVVLAAAQGPDQITAVKFTNSLSKRDGRKCEIGMKIRSTDFFQKGQTGQKGPKGQSFWAVFICFFLFFPSRAHIFPGRYRKHHGPGLGGPWVAQPLAPGGAACYHRKSTAGKNERI
jgi:hypothetical protein